ncbi:hypothetical protein T265_05788 [Opisthorchis viverrini]|uniref:DUF5730 domain-containing protein n=1 Tax=Opisthorchis viverrini TaxID=6198 RepID=A0A074ZUN0_OPIVI|nr:hypothetical protein T265_05788 [Opisthorchis viverrini]KER27090.1 hypothetical protein T265_05788 [Opisthorchis viverrini]
MEATQDQTERLETLPTYQNHLFVFMIVGLITLLPLTILTAVMTIRTGIPKLCRFICLCATMALAAGVTAMLLLYFALGPNDLQLARGDQIMIGEPGDGYLIGANQLRSLACNRLTIQTTGLGVIAWAVSVSLNLGQMQNYSLTLHNWTLPAHVRLRLKRGDRMGIRNYTAPIRAVILQGESAWNKWIISETHKFGYEKCCAWKELDTYSKDYGTVEANEDEIYTVIIRQADSSYKIPGPQVMSESYTGAIDLQRVRWAPTPCDPTICDGTSRICETDNTPKRYVIDYAVETMTAPPYDSVHVRVLCHPRHWALGLIFSVIPILVATLTLIVWRTRRNAKQLKFLDTVLERTIPATHTHGQQQHVDYQDRNNPAFELDIV